MTKARDLANGATALSAVSATELGYLDGVTSAVQTQINNKQAVVSGVNDTEIGYLDGVTSAIQTQLGTKIGQATAINPTIVDAKGDIIAAIAADTVARLAVGANATVLTADSAEATGLKWTTPSSGGMTLLSTTTLSGTTTSITGISGSFTDLVVDWSGVTNASNTDASINPNGNAAITDIIRGGATLQQLNDGQLRINNNVAGPLSSSTDNAIRLVIANYAATTSGGKPFDLYGGYIGSDSSKQIMQGKGRIKTTSAITQLDFVAGTAFTAGTVKIYGRK